MLKTMISEGLYSIHDGFEHWEDALHAAIVPLVKKNIVTEKYADSIINGVHTYGSYIVIVPDICIPHAQDAVNVLDSAICLMKTLKPVKFSESPDECARIFFVLAARDEEIHLKNMKLLMELLMDEALVARLAEVSNEDELKSLVGLA